MIALNASGSVRRLIRGPVLIAAGVAAFLVPLLADAMAQDIQRQPAIPSWEAVSVKPCAVRGARGGGARLSPGRMALNCQPVSAFVAWAYVQYAGGRAQPFYAVGNGGTAIEGGPSWIYSDRYTIEATVNGSPSNAVMQGPMLQAILEDRFKVKVHTETREVPMYHVTVHRAGRSCGRSSRAPVYRSTCTASSWAFGSSRLVVPVSSSSSTASSARRRTETRRFKWREGSTGAGGLVQGVYARSRRWPASRSQRAKRAV
jgi:uncharacterized protein (TIGR03435 family)